jgi:hypothetical protein
MQHFPMKVRLAFLVLAGALAPSAGVAAAQERGATLASHEDVRRACTDAERDGPRKLHAVTVPRGAFSFAHYDDEDGFLAIDTRRNLRVLGGAVELLPAGMEPIGFVVGPERARAMRSNASALSLRVGFFLGFDNPTRTLCMIRPAVGVTIVRMDVAFLELVDGRGRVIAREDTDRLRAWLDDVEREEIAGEGPRGALLAASRGDGSGVTPDSWQRAFAAANQGPVARALATCHEAGVARGASDGEVFVRVVVDGRTGAIASTEVELSTLGDDEEAACVARVVSRVQLTPEPTAGPHATLSVPVRLRR